MTESGKQITLDLQFMRRLVHDLRGPWQSIACFLHLLKQDVLNAQLSDATIDYISLMDSSAQELKELVSGLSEFVHAHDECELRTEAVRKIFQQALSSRVKADDETVAVNQLSDRSIHADPRMVAGCFAKLIDNAMVYRSADRPLQIEVRDVLLEDEWWIELEDNGIGVEEKYLERCLLPFERLHTRSAYPGSGLGLYTANALLGHIGGRVELVVGSVGTIARLRLPLACLATESGV